MPTFAYRARDAAGRTREGSAVAPSESAVAADLRGGGLLILDVRPLPARAAAPREGARISRPVIGLPATSLDVQTSLRQLALMHRSGITLLAALRTVADTARRASMARLWRRVADRIEAGSTLGDALAAHPRQFSPLTYQLIRSGEHSGTLDQAMLRAADHLERRRTLRATLLQALFYPSIVIALTIAVSAFMVMQVIPALETFLQGFHRRLPPLTAALLGFSHWLRLYFPLLAVAALVTLSLIALFNRLDAARLFFDRVLSRVPFVGRARTLATTAEFARTISVLLASGIDIVSALRLAEGVMGRPLARRSVAATREAILAGHTFSEGLAGSPAFLPMLARMAMVGEQSGALDEVLRDVADFHETELKDLIRRASILVEPVVTILVGTVVGIVYTAFFLAMFAVAGGR
jgi:type IV pilus assembly protein PilC